MNGNDLILMANGVAIAASKSCSVNTQSDEIEVSSPADGEWKTFLAGRKEWTVSCDYLVTHGSISSVLAVGAIVSLSFNPVYPVRYNFSGVYAGEVSDQVYRGSVDSIWYSTTLNKFVAKVGNVYYQYFEDPASDLSMFITPQLGVSYIGGFSEQKYYVWNGASLVYPRLSGSALCKQCAAKYTRGSLATGTFSFKGTGALSYSETI